MTTKYGFTKYSPDDFATWIESVSLARTVTTIQQHHTWRPNYDAFTGQNHFEMQRSMKHHHVSNNGWSDIGQHFSIFPDGSILTGRPLHQSPACIYGANSGAICIESIGDFDKNRDEMKEIQRQSILKTTAALLKTFSKIPRTSAGIVYHHWFDLNTGARRNGSGVTKSCPGTAFFGGNKIANFEENFLPQVLALIGEPTPDRSASSDNPIRLVRVTASELNIRQGPGIDHPRVSGQPPVLMGSILRV